MQNFVHLTIDNRYHDDMRLRRSADTKLFGFVDFAQAKAKAIAMGRNAIKWEQSRYKQLAIATRETEGEIVIELSYFPNEKPFKIYTINYA
jgi:hypothetical protein